MPYYDGNGVLIAHTQKELEEYRINERFNDVTKKVAILMKVIDKQKKEINRLKKALNGSKSKKK